jgi:hypothetical protein
MAEINKINVFSDVANNTKKALVDSNRRVVVVIDSPITISQAPAGFISNSSGAIPKDAEFTIVSYVVPALKKFRLTGFTGSGSADGLYKLYINLVQKMELRSSAASPNVGKTFSAPMEFNDGDIIALKVIHRHGSVQTFFGDFEGYLA